MAACRGIDFAVDHHHAVFADLAIGAAAVEKLHDREFASGQLLQRCLQIICVSDLEEILAVMKTKPAQQKWTGKTKIGGGL